MKINPFEVAHLSMFMCTVAFIISVTKSEKKDMAMFKYLRPLKELQSLDGFNSSTVPSKTISEVSKQIKDVVEQMCVCRLSHTHTYSRDLFFSIP